MNTTEIGILGIVVFLLLAFMRMPVGFALLLVGFVGYWYLDSLGPALATLSTVPYRLVTSYSFTALPPFALMGQLAFYSGLSANAYDLARKWVGHLRGGLSMATIAASAMFAAVTGSPLATALTMMSVSLPEMRKAGYDDRLSTGSIANGSILGPMIPPSTIFIIYAFLTGENLGALFMAGILPGILLTIIYIVTVALWCKVDPKVATRATARAGWRERIFGLSSVWAVVLIFVLVLGGIYLGIFTPTEAGAIGVSMVLIVSLARRKLSRSGFSRALLDTGRATATIMFLFVGVYVFNSFLVITRIPYIIADVIVALPLPPLGIMAVILLMYILFGFFIDCIAVVFITVPILFPAILSLGFDPLWFGVMIVLVAGIGSITPPFGTIVFAIYAMVKEIPMATIFRGCIPFVYANLVGVIILMFLPWIATWLPSLMKFG